MRPSIILAAFSGISALCGPIANTDANSESTSIPPLAIVERAEEAVEWGPFGDRTKRKIKWKLPDGHKCQLKIKTNPQQGPRWKWHGGQRCKDSSLYLVSSYEPSKYKIDQNKRDESASLAETADTAMTDAQGSDEEYLKWDLPNGQLCEVTIGPNYEKGSRYKWKHGGAACEASYRNGSYEKGVRNGSHKPSWVRDKAKKRDTLGPEDE